MKRFVLIALILAAAVFDTCGRDQTTAMKETPAATPQAGSGSEAAVKMYQMAVRADGRQHQVEPESRAARQNGNVACRSNV